MKAAGAVSLGGAAAGLGLAALLLLGRGGRAGAVAPLLAIARATRMRTVRERKQEALMKGEVMMGLGGES